MVAVLICMNLFLSCSKAEGESRDKYYLSYNQLSKYAFETLELKNGLKINYRIQGNPNGKNLLLIHGGGDSQSVWDIWLDSLKSDYRIITFDLPGHGLSDPLPNADYSISKFVEYTKSVVDGLNLSNFILGGHSFGGETALYYVLANPGKVQKLLLVCPGGFIQDYEREAGRQITHLTDKQVEQYYFPEFRGSKEEYKKGFKDYYYNINRFSDESLTRMYMLSRYDKNRKAVTQFNINHLRNDKDIENLNTISIPTLLLWGKNDKILFVKTAEKFKAEIQHVDLILYDQVGHMLQEEHPQSINDVLHFLEGRSH